MGAILRPDAAVLIMKKPQARRQLRETWAAAKSARFDLSTRLIMSLSGDLTHLTARCDRTSVRAQRGTQCVCMD